MLTYCTPFLMSSGRLAEFCSRSSSGSAVELTRSLCASFCAARASCSCLSCFATELSASASARSFLTFSLSSSSESSLNLSCTRDASSDLRRASLTCVSLRWPSRRASSDSSQQHGRRCTRLCRDSPMRTSPDPNSDCERPPAVSTTLMVMNGSRAMSSGMSTFILPTCRNSKLDAVMSRLGPVLEVQVLSCSDFTRWSPPGITGRYSNLSCLPSRNVPSAGSLSSSSSGLENVLTST
mmetsp:Transcript_60929/g.157081  ORF Transcript_60929/g.157081 Transcript_60929/m.157081 type:complete len:238 (-) Transcript_60929:2303-3016(-)